jgi:trehalose 6-phosphate phosphatase
MRRRGRHCRLVPHVKDILLARHRPVLERLARDRALLAFDYDGVLAPLVTDPRGAPMGASTRRLLAAVARRWPCAIVSGRAWAHTRALSGGVVPLVVGNHGYELGHPRPVPAAVLRQVRGWRDALERELSGQRGVHFEDKRSTLAVHYGLERRWRAVEAAVHREAERLEGARLVRGKKVLNVIPAGFPNKGDAVRSLLRKLRLDVALYAGDDVTDEDVFALGPERVVGVRVGPGPSRAPFRVSSQERVDELLGLLLELRGGRAARRRSG